MKSLRKTLPRILSVVFAVMLALTAVLPAFAANDLEVVIHNNKNLPPMTADQFSVYQLFKGTPERKGDKEPGGETWEAEEWNNYTLTDITWGDSVKDSDALLAALQNVDWANGEFNGVKTAVGLADVLKNHLNDNAFLQNFSKAIAKSGALQEISVTPVLAGGDTSDTSDDTLTYTLSETGYYLFAEKDPSESNEHDATSEYILAVIGKQDIYLKASAPEVDKDIVGGDNGDKGDAVAVNDYVQFKLTGNDLPKNLADFDKYVYVFHDKMSDSLTFVNDDEHPLKVYVVNAGERKEVSADYYNLVQPADDGCTFDVKFDDLKVLKDAEGNDITVTSDSIVEVTYFAQVNEKAKTGNVTTNNNEVKLEYSNNSNDEGTGETTWKEVYVYSFGLDLTKIGSDEEGKNGLEGASFVMKNEEGAYAKFEAIDKGLRFTGWTNEAETEAVNNAITAYNGNGDTAALEAALKDNIFTSGAEGKLPTIYGIDEGTYTLQEVVTPAGYHSADYTITIDAEVDENGKLTKVIFTHNDPVTGKVETVEYIPTPDDYESGKDEVLDDLIARFESGLLADTLVNTSTTPTLPFTGGAGTVMFYVLGIAMIAGAVVYLVISTKRRNRADSNA